MNAATLNHQPILVTASEAARMLAIGESTLWRKVSEHEP